MKMMSHLLLLLSLPWGCCGQPGIAKSQNLLLAWHCLPCKKGFVLCGRRKTWGCLQHHDCLLLLQSASLLTPGAVCRLSYQQDLSHNQVRRSCFHLCHMLLHRDGANPKAAPRELLFVLSKAALRRLLFVLRQHQWLQMSACQIIAQSCHSCRHLRH